MLPAPSDSGWPNRKPGMPSDWPLSKPLRCYTARNRFKPGETLRAGSVDHLAMMIALQWPELRCSRATLYKALKRASDQPIRQGITVSREEQLTSVASGATVC